VKGYGIDDNSSVWAVSLASETCPGRRQFYFTDVTEAGPPRKWWSNQSFEPCELRQRKRAHPLQERCCRGMRQGFRVLSCFSQQVQQLSRRRASSPLALRQNNRFRQVCAPWSSCPTCIGNSVDSCRLNDIHSPTLHVIAHFDRFPDEKKRQHVSCFCAF
jgi:hypothetical protein